MVKLIKIPYWYLRVSAKSIILKNISLFNFFKNLLQFNLILEMTKNSSFFIKLLILIESLLNIIWYSLVSTFKTKKNDKR